MMRALGLGLGLTRARIEPIGLDIGHDGVKLLQVGTVGESVVLHAAARQAFSGEARLNREARLAQVPQLVREALKSQPFRGTRVVAALPRQSLHIKNIRLPQMPLEELEQAVVFEARNVFPFDTDQARVHFLPAGEVRQGNDTLQEVIVMAARNEDVDNLVEVLHTCGVVVDSLDAEPSALFRSVERFIRRREDEQEVHVLVDVGLGGSQVVIGRGREISFLKTIEIGGAHLNEAVSQRLNIPVGDAAALRARLAGADPGAQAGDAAGDAEGRDTVRQAVFDASRGVLEQLAREVALCLRYQSVTFRGHRPARVRLLGGEAADPHLQQLLTSTLTVPVEPGKPLLHLDCSAVSADVLKNTESWALALGLALRRTAGRFKPRDGRSRASAVQVIEPAEAAGLAA